MGEGGRSQKKHLLNNKNPRNFTEELLSDASRQSIHPLVTTMKSWLRFQDPYKWLLKQTPFNKISQYFIPLYLYPVVADVVLGGGRDGQGSAVVDHDEFARCAQTRQKQIERPNTATKTVISEG